MGGLSLGCGCLKRVEADSVFVASFLYVDDISFFEPAFYFDCVVFVDAEVVDECFEFLVVDGSFALYLVQEFLEDWWYIFLERHTLSPYHFVESEAEEESADDGNDDSEVGDVGEDDEHGGEEDDAADEHAESEDCGHYEEDDEDESCGECWVVAEYSFDVVGDSGEWAGHVSSSEHLSDGVDDF